MRVRTHKRNADPADDFYEALNERIAEDRKLLTVADWVELHGILLSAKQRYRELITRRREEAEGKKLCE